MKEQIQSSHMALGWHWDCTNQMVALKPFCFDKAATIPQGYETLFVSKCTLRIYHSFLR